MLLKNGEKAVFRSPAPADAAELLQYLKTCASETDFLLRYPEECPESEEEEAAFLQGVNESDTGIMIVCTVKGWIAGNCHLTFYTKMKIRHRAGIAIGLLQEYWGRGIGTAMMEEMIELAKRQGVSQLELEFIEGNERAKGLYEKMGFRVVTVKPDAFRLRDGSMRKEYGMVRRL